MTDLLFPPYLYPDSESVEVVDNNTVAFRPQFALGPVQRQEFGAPILKVTQKYSGMSLGDRSALLSFIRQCRGRSNAIWLSPLRYAQRGSFPATEIFTNNSFSNGSVGWSASGSSVFTVSDRIGYLQAGSSAGNPSISQSASLTQYAPHVLRSFIMDGQETPGVVLGRFLTDGLNPISDYAITRGLGSISLVSASAASQSQYALVFGATSGFTANAVAIIPWSSLSRCALVDNGPNALLWSDQFNQSSWNKAACTISSNTAVSPDGTSTADSVVEDGTSATHGVYQDWTVSATTGLDYCSSCVFSRSGRSWAFIQMDDLVDSARAWINLTTGVLGTVTRTGNWTNARSFVKNLGANWFQLFLVAKKGSSATTVRTECAYTTGDTTVSYTGTNGSTAGYLWRGGVAQSSVPFNVSQTVGTSAPTGNSPTGSSISVKGLPVSTNGLLLAGDLAQIGNELKQLTAPLNSDSAGIGFLQFEPPLFRSPSDNNPVIICNPMGKFILADNGKITNQLGRYADVDLVFEEITE